MGVGAPQDMGHCQHLSCARPYVRFILISAPSVGTLITERINTSSPPSININHGIQTISAQDRIERHAQTGFYILLLPGSKVFLGKSDKTRLGFCEPGLTRILSLRVKAVIVWVIMALLDTTHASPHSMYTSLIHNGYTRNPNYSYYEQDIARFNLQQRLHSSPEQTHYDLHARLLVKEERLAPENYSQATAFKPYSNSPPDQENVPQQTNQQLKVAILKYYTLIGWQIMSVSRKE